MPVQIPFEWHEDDHVLSFILQVRGVKAKHVDVALCDVYIKVNCHPSLFEVDLCNEIDPEHPKTLCRIGSGKVTLTLHKKVPGLWHDFRAQGSKTELRERRQASLQAAAEREQERIKKKDDRRYELVKAGEHEQWRLDRENREQIEKWEAEEKEKWERDFYSSFDEESALLVEPAAPLPTVDGDLDDGVQGNLDDRAKTISKEPSPPPRGSVQLGTDKPEDSDLPKVCEVTEEEAAEIRATNAAQISKNSEAPLSKAGDKNAIWTEQDFQEYEEYVPAPRENPGKVGFRFTERPRPGVPVRDRGQRAPPFPKGTVKSDAPPMLAGLDEHDEDDPVWLKDKADNLMVAGDYQGAHNAYTSALKLGTNARCFANRAVADLYLGNLEQCIEDSTRGLSVLAMRRRVPEGQMPPPEDPEDSLVHARLEIRMATAYLWLGAFKKSEEHFQKALDVEDGLNFEERQKVKQDLTSVQAARAALVLKDQADHSVRCANGSQESEALEKALNMYGEAVTASATNAIVYANRCFAQLKVGNVQQCLEDSEVALDCLRQWPIARRAPKQPARPTRLDPPYLDDPTFKHPDEVKQGEADWLMKHNGGTSKDLPELPPEYEWVKDTAEKNDNAWIAIKKKMTRHTIEAIRRATTQLQDALYTRNPNAIRQQLPASIDLNKTGLGPSNKAIREAQEYCEKLDEYAKEQEAERQKQEEELKQELETCDLQDELASMRSGVARAGFGRSHPVENTRRRLFVKVLLRRARAFELMSDMEAAVEALQVVRKVEPSNLEAKQRLLELSEVGASLEPAVGTNLTVPSDIPTTLPAQAIQERSAPSSQPEQAGICSAQPPRPSSVEVNKHSPATNVGEHVQERRRVIDDADDDEDATPDHAAVSQLLSSASEYMRKNDYTSALQIYNYMRRRFKSLESLLELKILSNTTLCYQRMRGRVPELIRACNDALDRIAELRRDGNNGVSEEMLLRMECACLSRRGSAYSQQQRTEESGLDAARVRELLAQVEGLQHTDN